MFDLAEARALADRFERAGMKVVAAALRAMAAELEGRRAAPDSGP